MDFQDKELRCRDCEANFFFTAGEQEFLRQKGLLKSPTRCSACREKRLQLARGQSLPLQPALAAAKETAQVAASKPEEIAQFSQEDWASRYKNIRHNYGL